MHKKIPPFCLSLIIICALNLDALSPPDPQINDIQGMPVSGLNFSDAGNNVQIALFVINCNTTAGFDVTFKFANKGVFKSGTKEIPMTSLVLDKVSGTLGAGLTEPVDVDILNNLTGNQYVWNPGAAQTTATENYIVELRASWDIPAGKLAGFYFESIEADISVGL
jgi:hypothetical protein